MEFAEDPKTGDFVQVEKPFYKRIFTLKNVVKGACVTAVLLTTAYVVNKMTDGKVAEIVSKEND